jgi:hypothetical protein
MSPGDDEDDDDEDFIDDVESTVPDDSMSFMGESIDYGNHPPRPPRD